MATGEGGQAESGGAGLRPGQVVAGRYRIRRRIGRGGAGEVYRADDLLLGRYLALKFPRLDGVPAGAAQRLAAEVAMAQRVSHPNVCRVHELGHHGKRVFLSMQLIDGESLREVLARTVGTLTGAETLRIAHDVCAALAAIHAAGVLFRDLKPANVMLDSDGRALVTDFGLAAYGAVADPGSGTFDYMAPEQHDGGQPSVQSDLYALGLVLYELFVGRPAFTGRTREERVERQRAGPPELPAGDGVEPQVREAIVRCLAPGPEERPATADEVAAMLPRRPDREADSGPAWIVPPQTLLVSPRWQPRPWRSRLLLAAVLVALAAVAALVPGGRSGGAFDPGDPPALQLARAREVIARAGLDDGEAARDDRYGFTWDPAELPPAVDDMALPGVVSPVPARRPSLVFWYRRSPQPLLPLRAGSPLQRYDDPPWTRAGMVGVQLDPHGRLLRFDAVPPAVAARAPAAAAAAGPDWRPWLAAAGLAVDRSESVAPVWRPPRFADRRQAWVGPAESGGATGVGEAAAGEGGGRLRVEAASVGGVPVSFRRFASALPATAPPVRRGVVRLLPTRTGRALASLWFAAVLVGAVLLARRHLFRHLADATGAFRVAVAVLAARTLVWLLGAPHLSGPGELAVANPHLAEALLAAVEVGVLYLAIEPFVRRFWPRLAASWVRLVYGRARDPLVGYHLLVGSLIGSGAVLWSQLYARFAGALGLPAPRPEALSPLVWMVQDRALDLQAEALRGLRQALAVEVLAVEHAVLVAFFAVVGVVLLRLLLRRPWLSRSAALLLFVAVVFPSAGHPAADLVMAAVASALWLFALLRFGFLAAAAATAVAWLLSSQPLTLDLSAWYAPGSTVALLAVAALAAYGFRTSLAGGAMLPAGWLRLDAAPEDGASKLG